MIKSMDFVGILNYLGITHDRALPFVILLIAMVCVSYRFSKPIKKSLSKINNAIIEIQTIAEGSGISLKHHLVESPGSPLAPTEYGQQLIVDSGLEKILNDNSVALKDELSKKLPKKYTSYDVQENARGLLISWKVKEIMNPVKKYAFDNGINIDVILKAGGLWLRDDFLGNERVVNPTKNE